MAASCGLCGELRDYHHAFQKGGRDHEATYLPPVVDRLTDLGQVKAENCRVARLLECPQCGTYYLYRSDYEFLVSGTEDEQWLERLKPEDIKPYREQIP